METIANKYNPKKHLNSRLGIKSSRYGTGINRAKATIDPEKDLRENIQLLYKSEEMYSALRPEREDARRADAYLRGDQWGDPITLPNGRIITEEQHIRNQGKTPMKNNRISSIVDTILGTWLQNPSKTLILARDKGKQPVAEMLQNAVEAALTNEKTSMLNVELLEKLLTEEVICSRVAFEYIPSRNRSDIRLYNIPISRRFYNPNVEDIRMENDITHIGEFADVPISRLLGEFARNRADEQIIRDAYSGHIIDTVQNTMGAKHNFYKGFWETPVNNLVRIYTIWYLKSEWRVRYHDPVDATYETVPRTDELLHKLAAINTERLQQGLEAGVPEDEIPLIDYEERIESFWYYKYLTPTGICLSEGETPYEHGSHPYSIVRCRRGVVKNIIDQQRYINRLITLIDFIISASAKGVLLVPEDSIPAGMDIDDFAEEWSKFNGVIKIKLKPGAEMPKQVVANSTSVGAFELLNLQLTLMQQISGVSGAAQGIEARSGTPASRYAQEAQNSATNLIYILDMFMRFVESRDTKVLKTIVQYYNEERYIPISGKVDDETNTYRPKDAKNIDWDLLVKEGTSTPLFRQMQEDYLWKMFEVGAIDREMFLSNSSLPFTDKLLDQITKAQQGNASPEDFATAQAAAQSGSDPKANSLIMGMLDQENRNYGKVA